MLKKVSIDKEKIAIVKKLSSKGIPGIEIARRLKISQPTLWRNMELLGLNNKKDANSTNGYFDTNSFFKKYKY